MESPEAELLSAIKKRPKVELRHFSAVLVLLCFGEVSSQFVDAEEAAIPVGGLFQSYSTCLQTN